MAHKGISHKVQYFANKEKGIVVARINDCKRDFISFLFDSCDQNALAYHPPFSDKEYDQLLMPNSFVGVAQLGENDIWDEELGKQIAYQRAKQKRDASFFKRVNMAVRLYERELDKLCNLFDAYGKRLSNNNEYREKKIAEKIQK